ncbi:MAG: hypothetical protein CL908_21245 [Deltaproteobacteria bacterium]|nr:hypothetical protein [Deltaproteobacteria bacterium]
MDWGRKGAAAKQQDIDRAWRRSLRAAVARDWAAAETWLERIVEADTSDLDAYHALARLYREQGSVDRAIRMHQNLLLRPDLDRANRSEALLELARDFETGGFHERAVASYEEVLDAEPRNAIVLERLISLVRELRDYNRALVLVRRLRRRDREKADGFEVEILLAQAQACVVEGDHDGARQALRRCLRRDKNCGRGWALLGELEVERGKDARAQNAWMRGAAAAAFLSAELYPKIGASFAARGKPAAYEKYLRGILEDRPQDHAARIALARTLSSRGETSLAIEELARAIEVAPDHMGLRSELGRQLLASGQEAEAVKAYASLLDVLERRPPDTLPVETID